MKKSVKSYLSDYLYKLGILLSCIVGTEISCHLDNVLGYVIGVLFVCISCLLIEFYGKKYWKIQSGMKGEETDSDSEDIKKL